MSEAPWLSIVGLGEDGPNGLSPASAKALAEAEIIMGATRHLALLPDVPAQTLTWPVPFADGIPVLKDLRGRRVVALASGDPFWYGAGSVFARHFEPHEWRALPAPSTFSHAAAEMGWPLETTLCIGLHAAPFQRLRPYLAPGLRAIVLLRDGAALKELSAYLSDEGFEQTAVTVLEALGGPHARVRHCSLQGLPSDVAHPVCVALDITGTGTAVGCASGRDDALFDHDGQITKRPVRALTLSALAPRPGECLWDLGAGSGSISIEWLLSHPSLSAVAVEAHATRAQRIEQNALRLGQDRLRVFHGPSLELLPSLPQPDAVFIGGGLSEELLLALWDLIPAGCRLVANGVTLEAEVLLTQWHARVGGDLLRIELARAKPLGTKRGWSSAYPIVQWSVLR